MDTYAEKDALTAYLFYRLLHHAENVYLLYNTESDELGGGEKSRYILQLEYELKQANPLADIRDMVYTVDSAPNTPDDTIRIIKDNPLLDILRVNLVSEHGMSPSAINTYINCTLQYYFKYVAKLKEQEDIEESIEASTLGSAVHYVLENLYKPTMGRSLPTDFAAKAIVNKEKINALLKESFEQRFDADSLKTGKNYLLYRVCLKLINEFLKQEDRTLKLLKEEASEVKLIMLEKEMEHLVETKAGTVRVKGKVDRVEMCNGIISIADYKTGTPLGSVIKSDDIALFSTDPKYAKAMQLLTYAWLYWRSNNSPDIQLRTGIYWLREIGKGFDPLKADGKDVINKELLLQFEAVLKNVLNELLDPAVPFTKTEHVERCSHCEFVRICRRD
jgi:RecB family exonuclease